MLLERCCRRARTQYCFLKMSNDVSVRSVALARQPVLLVKRQLSCDAQFDPGCRPDIARRCTRQLGRNYSIHKPESKA
jgi:hypothetical protein